MADKNLCAVLKKQDDLCLENREIPVPAPNEVLIAIHSVGICGSDVHYWKNGRIGDFVVEKPMILGHESSGTVVKTGDDVKHLKPGDRVTIEPGVSCGHCEFCRKGKYNLCLSVKFCATPPDDGSLCNYYCHDAAYCFKLPDNVSLEEGALLEPLSVAVYACQRANVCAGQRVLICGAGPIGLLCLLTCKAMGVTKICMTDISESRLAVAKQFGGTKTACVKGLEAEAAVTEVTHQLQGLPDVTLECSGAEASVILGLKATKSAGVLQLVGIGPPEMKIPLIEATVREVDIRGVFRYANCYPTALELVASGAIDMKPLVTHRFKLEEAIKAFETARSGEGIKIVINCEK